MSNCDVQRICLSEAAQFSRQNVPQKGHRGTDPDGFFNGTAPTVPSRDLFAHTKHVTEFYKKLVNYNRIVVKLSGE
jgi:hypothetical protein